MGSLLFLQVLATTELSSARFGHGLAMLDGYICAVGGYGDDGGRLASVERYSDTRQKWE